MPQVGSMRLSATEAAAEPGVAARGITAAGDASATPALPAIAINGRFLTQRIAGVQRFASEICMAIDDLIERGEYSGLAGRIQILAPRTARDFPLRHIPLQRCGVSSGYLWEQVEFPLHAAGQLLLNLCMLGPLAVRRQVVVVHDATVRAFPSTFSRNFRAAYNFLIPRLCRRADCAVTVSEFSRQEIGNWYGIDVGNMPICFEGGDHIARIEADYSVIERLGLRGRKFFLGVGVGRNKNVENVIAAFVKAGLPDTLLVHTGKRDLWVHGQQTKLDTAGVCAAGYVSDAELRALYEQALALVFPSRYEGFGLPPVEAMMCGCPVIISDQPALVEMYHGAALQCGMDDVDELARLMRLLHDDPESRAALIAAGRDRAARFTWTATARFLLDLCLQVHSGRRRR
jgi:glycosyltransferase involved in cell wall biosynthesis